MQRNLNKDLSGFVMDIIKNQLAIAIQYKEKKGAGEIYHAPDNKSGSFRINEMGIQKYWVELREEGAAITMNKPVDIENVLDFLAKQDLQVKLQVSCNLEQYLKKQDLNVQAYKSDFLC